MPLSLSKFNIKQYLLLVIVVFSFSTHVNSASDKAEKNDIEKINTLETGPSKSKDQPTLPSESILSKDKKSLQQTQLLKALAIKQGKGHFTQKKFFKFLSQPIQSKGRFVVKDKSALWQTDTPVFTQLLIKPDAIYQRQSIQNEYQALIKNSQLSSILTTIFKAQINQKDWQLLSPLNSIPASQAQLSPQNCVNLKPKTSQLATLFKQITFCLLDDKQRQVDLIDRQENKTEILIQLESSVLTPTDLTKLGL